MPFAKKFRAMMNFPFAGERLGNYTVESVDVRDERGGSEGYVYAVRIVLRGPGGKQGVRRALRSLFSSHPTTFSGYGNPYQLWFRKPGIESLGDKRYMVRVEGGGARICLAEELHRFLTYLDESGQLVTRPDQAVQEAPVEAYLEQYQAEVRRKVSRYRSRLRRTEEAGT